MSTYDLLSFGVLGDTAASESFAVRLEGEPGGSGDTVAEAEVSVTVRSSDDQAEAFTADQATESTDEAVDATGSLMIDHEKLHALNNIVKGGQLSVGLFKFVNGNGQLNSILKTDDKKIVGIESLKPNDENAEAAAKMSACLETAFVNADENVRFGFSVIGKRLAKMEKAVMSVTGTRSKRVAQMIAMLEAEGTPDEVEVKVDDEPAASETTEVAAADHTEPDGDETKGDDTTGEPAADNTAEAGDDDETTKVEVTTDADVTEPSETEEAVESLKLSTLESTPVIEKLSAAAFGNKEAFMEVHNFVNGVGKARRAYMHKGTSRRVIIVKKPELLAALTKFQDALTKSADLSKLYYGGSVIAKKGAEASVATFEAFQKTQYLFMTAAASFKYLKTSKNIMDSAYHNLMFLASKFQPKGQPKAQPKSKKA